MATKIKYLLPLFLLISCATLPDMTAYRVHNAVRDALTTCLATADNKYVRDGCFNQADNNCMNADQEPDCHGVSR